LNYVIFDFYGLDIWRGGSSWRCEGQIRRLTL